MPFITVSIKNLDKVYVGLDRVGTAIPSIGKRTLRKYMKEAMEATRDYSTPQPRGSRYIRTGAYFAGFSLEDSGGGSSFSTTIFSRLARAAYIGGDSEGGGQSYNTGHWQLLRSEVDSAVGQFLSGFEEEIIKKAKSVGLDARMSAIGQLGGFATFKKIGRAGMAAIGRLGGLATARKRRGG